LHHILIRFQNYVYDKFASELFDKNPVTLQTRRYTTL